jgi:hypothetical protein
MTEYNFEFLVEEANFIDHIGLHLSSNALWLPLALNHNEQILCLFSNRPKIFIKTFHIELVLILWFVRFKRLKNLSPLLLISFSWSIDVVKLSSGNLRLKHFFLRFWSSSYHIFLLLLEYFLVDFLNCTLYLICLYDSLWVMIDFRDDFFVLNLMINLTLIKSLYIVQWRQLILSIQLHRYLPCCLVWPVPRWHVIQSQVPHIVNIKQWLSIYTEHFFLSRVI